MTNALPKYIPIHVLFADDDIDDRFFFDEGLSALPIPTQLKVVENGEQLLTYLNDNVERLPDILFLDINMPRKNGLECLIEIKKSNKLKLLPVIIYSSNIDKETANILYDNDAHYYVRKTDSIELQNILHHVLTMLLENRFMQPERRDFILTLTDEKNNFSGGYIT